MNKIKLLLWVSLLTMSYFVISAQNDLCATDADDPDILQGIPPYYRVITAASYDTCTFSLFFHIIRRSNGTGGQTISASEFSAGIYLYALITDGQEADVKRMILTE